MENNNKKVIISLAIVLSTFFLFSSAFINRNIWLIIIIQVGLSIYGINLSTQMIKKKKKVFGIITTVLFGLVLLLYLVSIIVGIIQGIIN